MNSGDGIQRCREGVLLWGGIYAVTGRDTRRVRPCRDHGSMHTLRRRATGRENIPRTDCSSGVGSSAHQWPSLKRHRSTNGAGCGSCGGNASFTTGYVGTARRRPKDTSWYGTRHERSRGCGAHGVITMVGNEGSEGTILSTLSSSWKDVSMERIREATHNIRGPCGVGEMTAVEVTLVEATLIATVR